MTETRLLPEVARQREQEPAERHRRAGTRSHARVRVLLVGLALLLVAVVAGGASGVITARLTIGSPPAGPASAPGDSLATMITRVSVSVVDIETRTTSQTTAGEQEIATTAGTGFVYAANGLIATNAHVVSGASQVTVTFADSTSVTGTVIGMSEQADLALVQIPRTGLTPLDLADSDELEIGDFVISIGNALALAGAPTVSVGIISARDRAVTTDEGTTSGLLQTSTGISSGDSGGPLLDPDGEVVGVAVAAAKSDEDTVVENIGFAIPSNTASTVLAQLAG